MIELGEFHPTLSCLFFQDIGCNVGSLTLEIGRRFAPKSLLGIDIDPELIRVAKKFAENLRDYQVHIWVLSKMY